MKIRMYSMEALSAFITRMTSSLETAFTLFNVNAPVIKFTDDLTVIEYKISNVIGLRSVSFEIDNEDFGLWVIIAKEDGSMTTFKFLKDFDETIDKINNNTMLKMQLECIKHGVENSIERGE